MLCVNTVDHYNAAINSRGDELYLSLVEATAREPLPLSFLAPPEVVEPMRAKFPSQHGHNTIDPTGVGG